ncbi:uncharacterized protein LOC135502045 isoform X2 [Lineus longissimus]|uniref:uncharacterized protein LOC135502045 isoform X2 n=1 Tax=Lineus longissimus TaxID=88925 RepID=UPI002B4F9900
MEKALGLVFSVCYMVFQLLLHSDALCPPKLLPGGTLTPNYAVGEIAELKCDVSSKTSTDTLHWKRGSEVMSEDDIVVSKYIKKFNVSLEANVYTLRFVVEPNDPGKYNCTCQSGGLQYYLSVKTPCNNCSYVTGGSSSEVIRTCKKGALLTITDQKQREPIGVELDCGCTSPGKKREFQWRWKFQQTKDSSLSIAQNRGKKITFVQPNRTPTGCYTGTDKVTYRFENITTIFNETFQCPWNRYGLYSLYVDDEIGTGEEPIFKVCCQDGNPECPVQPLVICFIIVAVVDLVCIIIIIYAIYTWRRQVTEQAPNGQRGFLCILITVGIVALIVLLALIGVAVTQASRGYISYIMKNCESVNCTDRLDSSLTVGTIILTIISVLIIVLVIWQVHYRVKNKKGYAVAREGTPSVHSTNVLMPETGQEMNMSNQGDSSQTTAKSGTTPPTERTEFGSKEFEPQQSSLAEVNQKKDSISEDEGVHVGGEAPSVGDIGSVSNNDPSVPV